MCSGRSFGQNRFALLLGPTVGMPIVRQHDTRYDGTYSYGLSYGGAASAMLRSYRSTWLVLSAEGGGEVFRVDGQRVARGLLQRSIPGPTARVLVFFVRRASGTMWSNAHGFDVECSSHFRFEAF